MFESIQQSQEPLLQVTPHETRFVAFTSSFHGCLCHGPGANSQVHPDFQQDS